jgi:hypothetical protein
VAYRDPFAYGLDAYAAVNTTHMLVLIFPSLYIGHNMPQFQHFWMSLVLLQFLADHRDPYCVVDNLDYNLDSLY